MRMHQYCYDGYGQRKCPSCQTAWTQADSLRPVGEAAAKAGAGRQRKKRPTSTQQTQNEDDEDGLEDE
jgi:hypothetical protein